MIARRVGEPGFVNYVHELRRLQVLSRHEVLAWLGLHGAVIRWTEPPFDDGESLNQDVLEELERELGST